MNITSGTLTDQIEAILDREPDFRDGDVSKFPFTYAYDFARQNAAGLGLPENMTRNQVNDALRNRVNVTGEDLADVIYELAQAYMVQNYVTLTDAEQVSAWENARRLRWQALGLNKPA